MTTRKIAAETTGPVTIDASLLRHGGAISVRTDAHCERAVLTISTTDEDGAAADAVRDATLRRSTTGLVAAVEGKGGGASGTTVITGGGRGMTVIQSSGSVHGSVVGMNFVGGNVYVNGARISGGATTVVTGTAPIEITATVPPGSKVIGRTDSADIEARGSFAVVSGHTQSGDIRVDHTEKLIASTKSGDVTVDKAADSNIKTMSGDVQLDRTDLAEVHTMSGDIGVRDFGGTARLKTMSGDIRVHATAGGDLDASSMSGDISVTATPAALDADLQVRPHSMSGRINVPSRRVPGSGPRRRS
ncbi:DUF4097 family beta strand repeat-containing protein [Streptomyces sp. NBC_01506]|uniref:DUF4097 family beta strand repeat-containing protein n=1 Tax=Streptomyces sp. NBC_01506 TaxID=2903887 RepID=UPI002F90BE7C